MRRRIFRGVVWWRAASSTKDMPRSRWAVPRARGMGGRWGARERRVSRVRRWAVRRPMRAAGLRRRMGLGRVVVVMIFLPFGEWTWGGVMELR